MGVWKRAKTYRGKRVVTCPETKKPVAVEVDALRAALSSELRLSECTRWPERADCGQECLAEIEKAPADCLVSNIVKKWYEGKLCARCEKPLEAERWAEHRPALLAPDGATVQWPEVAPERLPDVFATHLPLCWDCHVIQNVSYEHPGLYVVRPERPAPRG